MNATEFIDAMGGNGPVARIAGVRSSAVSNWRKAGRIPARLYLRFAAAARERGVSVPPHLFQQESEDSEAAA